MPAMSDGSPRSRSLVAGVEPVPAFLRRWPTAGLRRIGDEERLLLRTVRSCACRRRSRRATACSRAASRTSGKGSARDSRSERRACRSGCRPRSQRRARSKVRAGGRADRARAIPRPTRSSRFKAGASWPTRPPDVAQGTPDPVAAVGPCFGRGRRPRRGPGSARSAGGERSSGAPSGSRPSGAACGFSGAVPRSTASASLRRPSRVRRVASAMSIFENAIMMMS